MQLLSSSFGANQPIPQVHSGDGSDISPELSWTGVPDGTREFALICDDPDAPTPEPWVHWIVIRIAAHCRQLPAGVGGPKQMTLPDGMLQGRNSWPNGPVNCYRGPLPPHGHGVHHYHFKLYALDTPLTLAAGSTKSQVLAAIQGSILDQAELIGTYQR